MGRGTTLLPARLAKDTVWASATSILPDLPHKGPIGHFVTVLRSHGSGWEGSDGAPWDVRAGHAWPCGLAVTLWAADRHLRFLGSRGDTIRAVLKENTESREQEGWLGGQCHGLSEEPGCSDAGQSKETAELILGARIHRAQNQTRIYTHIDLRISQA